MRAGIFGRPSQWVVNQAAKGLEALGCDLVWQRPSVWTDHQAQDFDIVLTLGTKQRAARIRDLYRERGVPVLVLDLSPIRRDGLWALWPYELNTVPDETSPDRLGLVHWGHRELGDAVLVCGQKADDAAHQMGDAEIRSWFGRTAHMAQEKLPGKRVVWRPHPQYPMEFPGHELSDSESVSLEDALEGVGALVTFNSTAGLYAIAQGVPTFVSPSCFYREAASGTGLPTLTEKDALPPREDLVDFFGRLTQCVWTSEELATPEPHRATLSRMA